MPRRLSYPGLAHVLMTQFGLIGAMYVTHYLGYLTFNVMVARCCLEVL
jgi:hypothetical protein